MRRAVAAAAALLAVLAAPACKPSSLTPGFIGERGLETPEISPGLWLGSTPEGGILRFQFVDDTLSDLELAIEGGCGWQIALPDPVRVEAGSFERSEVAEAGGFFTISGTFTSPVLCQGSFQRTAIPPRPGCPRDVAGSFIATVAR